MTPKERLRNIISQDRFNQGVGELSEKTGKGCGFITIACIYLVFNAEKPLPRTFERDPIHYSPDLSLELGEFFEFVDQYKGSLGYEVESAVFIPGTVPYFCQSSDERSQDLYRRFGNKVHIGQQGFIRADIDTSRREIKDVILNNISPCAAIFRHNNGSGHIEACTVGYERCLEMFEKLNNAGYFLTGYLTFKSYTSANG